MSTTRTRSEVIGASSGRARNVASSFTRNSYNIRSRNTIVDVVSRPAKPGQDLTITKVSFLSGTINGSKSNWRFENYLPDAYSGLTDAAFSRTTSISNMPTDSALLTALISRTNPESTQVNFPLFVFELREFPRLLQGMLKYIREPRLLPSLRTPAGTYLGYQFGIKPFVSDLRKMILCLDDIEKRARQMQEIERKGGKTFVRDLFSATNGTPVVYNNDRVVQSAGLSIYSDESTRFTNVKVRGYATWTPKVGNSLISSRDMFRHAWRTYHGLRLRPADLWDAMPWSWLIDYALNVGDFIEANQGALEYRLTDYALMKDVRSVNRCVMSGVYLPATTHLKTQYLRKTRYKPALSIDTKFEKPLLTAYQTSILGSLATTRLFK